MLTINIIHTTSIWVKTAKENQNYIRLRFSQSCHQSVIRISFDLQAG